MPTPYKQAFIVTMANGRMAQVVLMAETPNAGAIAAVAIAGTQLGGLVWDCGAYPVGDDDMPVGLRELALMDAAPAPLVWENGETRSSLGDLYTVHQLSGVVWQPRKNGVDFDAWSTTKDGAEASAERDYRHQLIHRGRDPQQKTMEQIVELLRTAFGAGVYDLGRPAPGMEGSRAHRMSGYAQAVLTLAEAALKETQP